MGLIELNEIQYDNFIKENENKYYLSTSTILNLKRKNNWEVKYLGYEKDNQLVAAIGMFYSPMYHFFRYAYALRGFYIDYNDKTLLEEFTCALQAYLKKDKIAFLRIDPYIIYQILDTDGNCVERSDTSKLFNNLNALGYKHSGFFIDLKSDRQCRYMMRIDLDDHNIDSLFKTFNSNTQRNIKKAIKSGVEIVELSSDNLKPFIDLLEKTSSRKHFAIPSEKMFKEQLEVLKNNACVIVAQLDTNKLVNTSKAKINELNQQLENLNNNKDTYSEKTYNKKLKMFTNDLEVENKKYQEAVELNNKYDVITLAGGYFVEYGDEVYYVSGGSDDEFSKFGGAHLMQWTMIQRALNHHLKYYNFTGISGDFNPDTSSDYGVVQFKKGLNGYPFELVGEFYLPVNKLQTKLIKLISKVK